MPSGLFKSRNFLLVAGSCYYSFDFWYDCYKFYYFPTPELWKRYGKNSYALITGATSGLGPEFAECLARQGFNLILISKNQKKLAAFTDFLNKNFSVQTLALRMDLSQNIDHELKILSSQSKNLDISLIINNSSVIETKNFEEFEFDEISQNVRSNCGNSAKIIYSMIPRLNQRASKSAIINVSSLLAVRPTNASSMNSAINAFNHYLSVALAEDLDSKIDILSFLPATFDVESAQTSYSRLLVSPKEAVSECIKDLGFKRVSYGHYKNTLAAYMIEMFPKSYISRLLDNRLSATNN